MLLIFPAKGGGGCYGGRSPKTGMIRHMTLSPSKAGARLPRQHWDDAAAIGIAAAVALSVPLWGVIGLLMWWFLL
jgi:hypothetical protein